MTAHDGSTLNDLVSYQRKHNEPNAENNRDGRDDEFSFNLGAEGETSDAAIQHMPLRQIKSFLETLLLSRGVPMILCGDELQRTQQGNNNAYCQDNEVSWYDWRLAETNADLLKFTRSMLDFRKRHLMLRSEAFYSAAEVQWFGTDGRSPSWERDLQTLGLRIRAPAATTSESEYAICLMFNGASIDSLFHLPPPPAKQRWFIAMNSAERSMLDIADDGREAALDDNDSCIVSTKTVVALISKPAG